MPKTVKSPVKKNPFRVNLDSEIVSLPGKSIESVRGIFVHLENLALRAKNEQHAHHGGGKSRQHQVSPNYHMLEEQGNTKISFREMGRHIIRTAQIQVKVLQARANDVQSLVLINNWAVADRLWSELLPDCKTPLFELNLLEELWGICPNQLEADGWTLTRHWQQFVLIQAEIEVLLARRQSLMELSNALENHFGQWLKRFGEILDKLDEQSNA